MRRIVLFMALLVSVASLAQNAHTTRGLQINVDALTEKKVRRDSVVYKDVPVEPARPLEWKQALLFNYGMGWYVNTYQKHNPLSSFGLTYMRYKRFGYYADFMWRGGHFFEKYTIRGYDELEDVRRYRAVYTIDGRSFDGGFYDNRMASNRLSLNLGGVYRATTGKTSLLLYAGVGYGYCSNTYRFTYDDGKDHIWVGGAFAGDDDDYDNERILREFGFHSGVSMETGVTLVVAGWLSLQVGYSTIFRSFDSFHELKLGVGYAWPVRRASKLDRALEKIGSTN